jgi:nucleoside-diphosphate-sugar epimerase
MSAETRRVLVTGGAGYVGSRLVPELNQAGYNVTVLDTCWYGVPSDVASESNVSLVVGDIRDPESVSEALVGVTDVIHLACISNDPSYDLDPKLGKSINLDAFRPLVEQSKGAGVERFIYASSSSVYGVKEEEQVTEDLSLEPLTDYSRFKADCETILLDEADDDFSVTVLRPATICGPAPRQRMDLTVNLLTNNAYRSRTVTVFGGEQFRPNLHIADMCRAYLHILKQDRSAMNARVFNVGGENLTVREIAELVSNLVGKQVEVRYEPTNDNRSYRISSKLIEDTTGFSPSFSVGDAIKDLLEWFELGRFPDSLSDSRYFNISRMQELIPALPH